MSGYFIAVNNNAVLAYLLCWLNRRIVACSWSARRFPVLQGLIDIIRVQCTFHGNIVVHPVLGHAGFTFYLHSLYHACCQNFRFMSCKLKHLLLGVRLNIYSAGSGSLFQETEGSEHSRWAYSISLRTGRPQRFMLKLRIPSWVKGVPIVTVGGERRFITGDVVADGYLKIDREWDEQEIKIYFPVELTAEALPDKPEKKAVMEGPIVLAALSDNVQLTDEPRRALHRVSEHSYDAWPWLQSHYVLNNGGREVNFIPLYEVGEQPYTLYCDSVKLV